MNWILIFGVFIVFVIAYDEMQAYKRRKQMDKEFERDLKRAFEEAWEDYKQRHKL